MKPNYIAGEAVPGRTSRPNHNPSDTSDIIGEYAQGSAADAHAAIEAASRAFPAWSRTNIGVRSALLDQIGSEIIARKDELGRLLSREEGKSLVEGIGEVTRAGQIFRFQAAEVLRQRGEKLGSVRPDVEIEITREPLGVVGLITPWNFPMAIPAWKIAPALAYGNTVVFKPADLVPGCAWELAQIIHRAQLPPGVFNLVMGRGSEVGRALLEHPKVAAISFTGSVATGRTVLSTAAQRFAKVQLEMGGKNPLIVLDDADLETAVRCAIQGAYYSTGQRCTASSRLIVQKGIYGRFLDAMVAQMKTLKVGDALDSETQIGPVVDASQLEQDCSYIEIGKSEGARLASGGERLRRARDGYYLQPALFADANNNMRIAREEIFGPVACAIAVASYDEALALANDTEFGLTSGICTSSLKHATHFKRNAEAGMVMVNLPTAGVDYHVPFGGRKGSSYGPREQGSYAMEFYTTVKTAYCGT